MPLPLTAQERLVVAILLSLLILGLIGMVVLHDEPATPLPPSVEAP